ncbi:unnamed protein product [Oppiella nova]|uniref:Uncharacterized protein n=1 Tax=Oppiella nova TaxID=334625 RepID=A0A7R9MM48_9ACAR|nr:unnamed protein product [Oppiella nova]CAG2179531.1 unnamed protein product [Oppiella nova]
MFGSGLAIGLWRYMERPAPKWQNHLGLHNRMYCELRDESVLRICHILSVGTHGPRPG